MAKIKSRVKRKKFSNPLNIKKILRPEKAKRLAPKKIWRILLWGVATFAILVVFLFAWFAKDLPTPGKIASRTVSQSTKIYDRTGKILLYETGEQKRTTVKSDQISDNLKNATVSIEDANFYKHHGFDIRAIFVAVYEKMTGKTSRARGASTITQQYVKNALLTSNRSFTRKIKELILSVELEIMYSKDEILTMYLNEIPYGNNIAGAEAAARSYYGKPASELSIAQGATLAAIPNAPTYYSPYGTHTKELIQRRNYIIDRMEELGKIDKDQAEKSKKIDSTTVGDVIRPRKDTMLAPHFAMYVIEQAANQFGEEVIQKEGLKIITTLDYDKQKMAEEAIASKESQLSGYGASNAALVSVDPDTGEIISMVGSIDYFNTDIDGNVNVADSLRQPGSSFKPFAYAELFKNKEYSPAKILWDLRTDFGGGYIPRNYNGSFEGPVTIRYALANSLNIPAVKTLSLAGIDNVLKTVEEMGITSLTQRDRYGLSLVLGSGEVKPTEMAGAYGVFAAEGVKHDIKSILKVVNSENKTIYEYNEKEDTGRQVLDPQIAYEISSILCDNNARSSHFGSRSSLYFSGKTICAKTGTTSSYKDAWTMGYSKSLATAVWVGNNSGQEMKSGAAGANIAAPIFHAYMERAVTENEPLVKPKGIQTVTVDKLSTKLPNDISGDKITDIFASWQVPTEKDDVHVKLRVCKSNGLLAESNISNALAEDKIFANVHSERPDYPSWEGPVRSWASSNGMANLPPTDKCTIENLKSTIEITSPQNGATVTGENKISAKVISPLTIKNVNFYIDNISVGNDTKTPYEINYNFNNLTTGNHKISAKVTDSNNQTASTDITVKVNKDSVAPEISNIQVEQTGIGSATISWTTSEDSLSQLIYGTTPDPTAPYSYDKTSAISPDYVTDQSISVTGLTSGTTYYFRAISKDQSGNVGISEEQSFIST